MHILSILWYNSNIGLRKQVITLNTKDTTERRHQEDLQRIARLRLMDDDFMSICFDQCNDVVEFVLRIILKNDSFHVIDVKTQYAIPGLNRGVRLNVLATDRSGKKINIEIQRFDAGAGVKRARFNSAMIDKDCLKKGSSPDELPETWVIFITERDVRGKGKATYCFDRLDIEDGTPLEDEAHIVYVNGEYRGDDPTGHLMHDFMCSNPDDMTYQPLADRTRYFKEKKEGQEVMCREFEKLREETYTETMKLASNETAKRMLQKKKYSVEEIADITGLSVAEVKQLEKEILATV